MPALGKRFIRRLGKIYHVIIAPGIAGRLRAVFISTRKVSAQPEIGSSFRHVNPNAEARRMPGNGNFLARAEINARRRKRLSKVVI